MRSELGDLVWQQGWQIAVLVSGVSFLSWYLSRRHTHVAYLLWILVVIKCLTPPVWSSDLGLFTWSQHWQDQWSAVDDEQWLLELDRRAQAAEVVDDPLAIEIAAPLPVVSFWSTGSGWWESETFRWGLWTAWVSGMVACGVVTVWRWRSLMRGLRSSQVPTPAWFSRLVEKVSGQVELSRRVRVLVSSDDVGPFMVGTWRPILVVPLRLVEAQDATRLAPIVAHELVHARRADSLIGWLQVVAQWVWWFHPLVWWANWKTTQLCERSCDDEVIARLGCRPHFYASCLLDVLEMKRRFRMNPAWQLAGVRMARVTRQRVMGLIRSRGVSRRKTPPIWGWVLTLFLAAIVLPGAARMEPGDFYPGGSRVAADLAFGQGDWERAVAHYQDVLDEDPNQGVAWFRLGYSLHALRRLDEAIIAHARASEFPGFHAIGRYNWACALALMGEDEKALKKLAEALEEGFSSPSTLANDPDFVSLHDHHEFQRLERLAQGGTMDAEPNAAGLRQATVDVPGAKRRSPAMPLTDDNASTDLLKLLGKSVQVESWAWRKDENGLVVRYSAADSPESTSIWLDSSGRFVRYQQVSFQDARENEAKTMWIRLTLEVQNDGRMVQRVEKSEDGSMNWAVSSNRMLDAPQASTVDYDQPASQATL